MCWKGQAAALYKARGHRPGKFSSQPCEESNREFYSKLGVLPGSRFSETLSTDHLLGGVESTLRDVFETKDYPSK